MTTAILIKTGMTKEELRKALRNNREVFQEIADTLQEAGIYIDPVNDIYLLKQGGKKQ